MDKQAKEGLAYKENCQNHEATVVGLRSGVELTLALSTVVTEYGDHATPSNQRAILHP